MSSFFLGICCRFFWDFRFVLIPFALGLVPDTFFCTFFFLSDRGWMSFFSYPWPFDCFSLAMDLLFCNFIFLTWLCQRSDLKMAISIRIPPLFVVAFIYITGSAG